MEDGESVASIRSLVKYSRRCNRICPGRAMGESSVFITVAAVLHMFSIEPPLDEHGVPSALDVKFGEGILS